MGAKGLGCRRARIALWMPDEEEDDGKTMEKGEKEPGEDGKTMNEEEEEETGIWRWREPRRMEKEENREERGERREKLS